MRRGSWGNLAILSGLGPEDLGSNLRTPRGAPRTAPHVRFLGRKSGQPHPFPTMAETKHLRSLRGLGARYGRRIRLKVAMAESLHRGKHACPYCGYKQVKRKAAGIWNCQKCNVTFTGRAYQIAGKAKILEEETEQIMQVAEKPKIKKTKTDEEGETA